MIPKRYQIKQIIMMEIKQRKLSATELAELCNLSYTVAHRLINGDGGARVTWANLEGLLKGLEIEALRT